MEERRDAVDANDDASRMNLQGTMSFAGTVGSLGWRPEDWTRLSFGRHSAMMCARETRVN